MDLFTRSLPEVKRVCACAVPLYSCKADVQWSAESGRVEAGKRIMITFALLVLVACHMPVAQSRRLPIQEELEMVVSYSLPANAIYS